LATVLFSFKKELLIEKKTVQKLQQFLIWIAFIGMIVYAYLFDFKMTHLSIIPWVWGFLLGHLYSNLQKNWFNELLGLGVLLAITIVLFFKQTDIISTFTTQIADHILWIHIAYMSIGIFLGRLLWPRVKK
jgi:hypothetical protein